MTTRANITRQTVLYAERAFSYDDFTSGVAKPLIYLRPGTQILGGYVDITTAFDAGSTGGQSPTPYTVALEIGDTEGTDDVDRYLTSTSVRTATRTALTPVHDGVIETSEALTGTITVGSGGTLAAGAGKVGIWYIEVNRVSEVNPYVG